MTQYILVRTWENNTTTVEYIRVEADAVNSYFADLQQGETGRKLFRGTLMAEIG